MVNLYYKMDWDYSPLSVACVRALTDKMYEKRKAAALEVEKMVKEFAAVHNTAQIKKLLKVVGQDFAMSKNQNYKKGGLIGLAAIAVALGKDSSYYTDELISPIIVNFSDSDLRVRYYACESLYNVIKMTRTSVLPHFGSVFEALCNLAADPDQNIKNASELLDRLLKDIVTEDTSFDLVSFMPLLRERMFTNNQFACQFIISWISVLADVPHIDLIKFLPEILDGLFKILGEPTIEIKKMCETVLNKFLRSIKQDSSRVNFSAMINIVTYHAQLYDELVQFTALTWTKEFVQLSGVQMLSFTSSILVPVFKCLSYDLERQHIKETAKAINFVLLKLIATEQDVLTEQSSIEKDKGTGLDLQPTVEVLSKKLSENSVETKVAVLNWISELNSKIPNRMFAHIEELFPLLLRTLSDTSDKVVHFDLKVLSEVISSPNITGATQQNNRSTDGSGVNILNRHVVPDNPYFKKFITSLLKEFSCDRKLLEKKGSFIIRQLCVLLNSEDVYKVLALMLIDEDNLKFASLMVEQLNTILLTSPELFQLRMKLKDLKTEESYDLFFCLYKTWCHNAVATISLCFLTQNYQHACDVIRIFSDLEITVDILTEVDRLIQLIESPIFTYLRLELLEVPYNSYLVRALYGLLMILPQSDAFHMLRHRLDCIPKLQLLSDDKQGNNIKSAKGEKSNKKFICFEDLLKHFVSVQEKHKEYKICSRVATIMSSNVEYEM